MDRICVLVADDNPGMLGMLKTLLEHHCLIGRAVANGRQLVDAALVCSPDVIVSDVDMPVLTGIEAMGALRALGRITPFVMVSGTPGLVRECLEAGAVAFVSKADIGSELIAAVDAARDGSTYISAGARPFVGRMAD